MTQPTKCEQLAAMRLEEFKEHLADLRKQKSPSASRQSVR